MSAAATTLPAGERGQERASGPAATTREVRGGLFRKFLLASIAVVVAALLLSSAVGLWFAYRDQRQSLIDLQHEKAVGAARTVGSFVDATQDDLVASASRPPSSDPVALRAQQEEFRRLLFQLEAVTDVAWLDAAGRELVAVSRVTPDRLASGVDRSPDPAVSQAIREGRGASGVAFQGGSEPHVTLAVRAPTGAVVVADLNARLVRDIVEGIRIGDEGIAYVVDAAGRLVAHPDSALVLAQTDLSDVEHVREALASAVGGSTDGRDAEGHDVLASYHPIEGLGWRVVVEQPRREVFAPVLDAVPWRVGVLALGVVLAVASSALLTRRMVAPLRVLQEGAARIGEGDLDHRIEVRTHDELEQLAAELNAMAGRLRAADNNLRASRQRLVAAQDEERRRIERNLHDGAQQELVALKVALGLIGQLHASGEDIAPLIDQAKQDAGDALESLRNLARGIYPPLLSAEGLPAALEAQARRAAVPVVLDCEGVGRYPQDVEAAVYFCCLESLQNIAKYADASSVALRLRQSDGHLRFSVTDDGKGFDRGAVVAGMGMQNMVDRVEALGGAVDVRSAIGTGTTVEGSIPIAP